MAVIQKIGQLIQQRRDNMRITQKQLADMADVGINTLYKIETGQANPTVKVLNKIAEILGMEFKLTVKKPEL
jgi:transcriptional regulator with XRE-family HTH domain